MSNEVEIIPVIRTRLLRRGDGQRTYVRIVEQFWSIKGELLWENDPCAENEAIRPEDTPLLPRG